MARLSIEEKIELGILLGNRSNLIAGLPSQNGIYQVSWDLAQAVINILESRIRDGKIDRNRRETISIWTSDIRSIEWWFWTEEIRVQNAVMRKMWLKPPVLSEDTIRALQERQALLEALLKPENIIGQSLVAAKKLLKKS